MIQLADPNITPEDIAAVIRVLQSGMLVQGTEVEALESEISTYLGVDHAIAVSNGTASLHLALVALGIGHGDEVIVPSFSYVATANVVELVGATPIFVDVDSRSFNLTTTGVASAVTPRTRAVIPVHEFGLPCDIAELQQFCRKRQLALIEDAACALGSSENGQFAGTFGDFGSYSLHPRKAVTSGEGGFLVTNDATLADKVRILRNHGIEMRNGSMEFVAAGFNYRMTDFQAALVRGQLARLPEILNRRREIAAAYLGQIHNPLFTLPTVPPHKQVNWQTFHLLVNPALDRGELIRRLRSEGIGTNYGAQCIPAQIFYRKKYNHDSQSLFPSGFHAWKHGLAIPAHEKLSPSEVSQIINAMDSITL